MGLSYYTYQGGSFHRCLRFGLPRLNTRCLGRSFEVLSTNWFVVESILTFDRSSYIWGCPPEGVPQNSIFRSGTEEWDYLNEPDKMRKRRNMRLCGTTLPDWLGNTTSSCPTGKPAH